MTNSEEFHDYFMLSHEEYLEFLRVFGPSEALEQLRRRKEND